MKKLFLILTFLVNSIAEVNYVGEKTCKECHHTQYSQWKSSHHDLSMQIANENTILGDFNNTEFTSTNGITTTFYQNTSKFIVHTDGPDGKLHNYEISYTFGVYPLQQYMIKFPDGRIQVLDIAWDSRDSKDGGQKWYHLHPHQSIDYEDVLHWTGPNLNWNYMCADCHSTNLKKNYDKKTHSYDTQWSSIDVSCEACHGALGEHVAWAKNPTKDMKTLQEHFSNNFSQLRSREWRFEKNQTTATLYAFRTSNELQVCAKCHSRRIQLDDNFQAGDKLHDHYSPLCLDEDLYFSDGQIKGEVYVYNSFLQSKMYEAGVTCSDCHNPHSLERDGVGDNVCFKCHDVNSYQNKIHHYHNTTSKGASCINCHMPIRTYMGIDNRNDHSFRIPRPDLSIDTDIPNACNNCHKEKTASWATQNIQKWYGKIKKGKQNFSHTLEALRFNSNESSKLLYKTLMEDEPEIAKATVASYLGFYPNKQTYATVLQLLKSKNIDIRFNALRALENFPIEYRLEPTKRAIKDQIKTIRIEAARQITGFIKYDNTIKAKYEKSILEYENTLLFTAERPESQSALALLYVNLGEESKAEIAFKNAIKLQKKFIPAYINYADFLSQMKREKEAFSILQKGISLQPGSGVLYHALALWYIRNNQKDRGLELIKKAASLEKENINIQYTYAVSIAQTNLQKAIKILEKILKRHSGALEIRNTLQSYYQQRDYK